MTSMMTSTQFGARPTPRRAAAAGTLAAAAMVLAPFGVAQAATGAANSAKTSHSVSSQTAPLSEVQKQCSQQALDADDAAMLDWFQSPQSDVCQAALDNRDPALPPDIIDDAKNNLRLDQSEANWKTGVWAYPAAIATFVGAVVGFISLRDHRDYVRRYG